MTHDLPPLPYDLDALDPYLSKETLDFHYNKHHATYVKNLNNLVKDSPHKDQDLTGIIQKTEPGSGIFNNAAQVWNHTFYWQSMTPGGSKPPAGKLKQALEQSFGSLDDLRQNFSDAGTTLFGSGWVWLAVKNGGSVEIVKTSNADTPIRTGIQPLIVCDVWEHAYYIDYRNNRPKYLEEFWNIINWDFAARNLQGS